MTSIQLIESLDDRYGGPAQSVPYLAKGLSSLGISSELVSTTLSNEEDNSIVNKYNLVWNRFPCFGPSHLRFSPNLGNFVRRRIIENPDSILHVHNLWNSIPSQAFFLKKIFHISLVVSPRGALFPYSLTQSMIKKRIAWQLFQKNMLKTADLIHVTDFAEMDAVRRLGIKTPIAVIPNGININEFKDRPTRIEARKSLCLNPRKKYILFLSRIQKKKGLEYLVSAWVNLAFEFSNWDLIIVGPIYDDLYFKDIMAKVPLGLLSRILISGMVAGSKRIDYFVASDLFVLPSHTENFGIAIAEAMACQLPIITTKGTPWSVLSERQAGWWIDLNEIELTRTMRNAMSLQSEELKTMGLSGEIIIQDYDWSNQTNKMATAYEWIKKRNEVPDFIFYT